MLLRVYISEVEKRTSINFTCSVKNKKALKCFIIHSGHFVAWEGVEPSASGL
jgi:hypothetical protein